MQRLSQLTTRGAQKVVHGQSSSRWGGYVTVIDPSYENIDPFIFLVHHVHKFEAGEYTGFPPHPHRGFETVTYIIEGGFDHGDSRGNKGHYADGDVQWLTTGKGVLHSEMFAYNKDKPTTFDGFQLWLNLPSKLKMSEPGYHMMWNKDIPIVTLKPSIEDEQPLDKLTSQTKNGNAWLKIIAGKVNEVSNPVPEDKDTIVNYFHVKLDPLATWSHYAPKEHNSFMYILKGVGLVGSGKKAAKKDYVLFGNDGDKIEITNTHETSELDFIYLEGKPLKEPFAHYGPFVMNTQQELREAFVDLQAGKFGQMDEPYKPKD